MVADSVFVEFLNSTYINHELLFFQPMCKKVTSAYITDIINGFFYFLTKLGIVFYIAT